MKIEFNTKMLNVTFIPNSGANLLSNSTAAYLLSCQYNKESKIKYNCVPIKELRGTTSVTMDSGA